jgi:hypothetical protein
LNNLDLSFILTGLGMPRPQIRIRPITKEDAPDVFEYASHALVAATCNVPHPYPKDGGITYDGPRMDRFENRLLEIYRCDL